MSRRAKWADLAPRVMTAAVLLAIGLAEVWAGGWMFALGILALCGLMIWELSRMLAPGAEGRALGLAALGVLALGLGWLLPGLMALPLIGAAAIGGAGRFARDKWIFGLGCAAILFGAHVLWGLREEAGLAWLLWIISLVILSDIAGYFAGKTFGGPKFWPAISPNKTWSGTIAGWIGAALVGLAFGYSTEAGFGLVIVSVLIAMAGQMGDIAESAIKRRVGVKDSSELLPGHGGVLDRFDAMLGAALATGLLWGLGLIPGIA
jgi:phosphatidate cytidylyltransferase